LVDPVQAFGANFNPAAYAENVAGSALVGCASAAASGGSCGSGAAAAAVSAGFAPVTGSLFPNASGDLGQRIGGTIVQATAGGLASVAGGGKFSNGAATSAFQYLVALGPMRDPRMDANDADVQQNRAAHEAQVDQEVLDLQSKGFVVTRNVTFIDVKTGVPVIADYVVSMLMPDPSTLLALPWPEPIYVRDVKTGNGGPTDNQQIVYPNVWAGGMVVPVGDNAARAGFTVGLPTRLDLYMGANGPTMH
jgi:hypothetical protein